MFRKALKLGLKPGPTQSHLLKGFAELKPEHGRIKSRVQLSFVVVANRDSVRVTGTGLGEGRGQAGRVAAELPGHLALCGHQALLRGHL